jgi:hypothetical protein
LYICKFGINIDCPGITTVSNNSITGSMMAVFGGNGWECDSAQKIIKSRGRLLNGNGSRFNFINNTAMGYFDLFHGTRAENVNAQNNTVYRFGAFGSRETGFGNVIYSHGNTPDTNVINEVKFINNTFYGWDYTRTSFNYLGEWSSKVVILNNKFLNGTSFGKPSDFLIINIYPNATQVYPSN